MQSDKIIFPRACRLLKDIDEAGFVRLCETLNARERRLRNKETFMFEGEPCDKVGIVTMGGVRLSRRRVDGVRNVLENVPPNDVFGTTYAFRDVNTVGITMSAVGDTIVLLFDVSRILGPVGAPIAEHLLFMRNLLAVMSHKTFQMKQKLRILSQRSIRARVMLFLQMCARRANDSAFDIPFDRQAMADYLCVDRCALSAELSRLQAEGKISFLKNHFRLAK